MAGGKKGKKGDLELLFLGSGNAFSPGRFYSSFLVNRRILFEATPTTLPAIRHLGIRLVEIEYLFISHFHADHCFGLPFIFLDHYFVTERKEPLTIIGPKGLRKHAYQVMDLAFPNARKHYSKRFPVKFVEVRPEKEYTFGDLTLKAYRMSHGHSPSLGFSLVYGRRRLAYCGDTGLCPDLTRLLQGADLAVLEMTSVADTLPAHLNRQDILEIRQRLPKETQLILTHLPALTRWQVKTLKKNPYGPLELAEDGKRFTFPL